MRWTKTVDLSEAAPNGRLAINGAKRHAFLYGVSNGLRIILTLKNTVYKAKHLSPPIVMKA